MNKTGLIIGDSSALPQELIQKYKIAEVIPFIVDWPEQKDVSQNNIYEKMKIAQKEGLKSFPKTSQPAIGAYKKAYDNLLAQDKEIICLTLSSNYLAHLILLFRPKNYLMKRRKKDICVRHIEC